ncbi:MAG: acetyl-CoA carboxylase biotin carboxyl carrier protein [Anaerohalosphaera sp.]|nr:acetyl-CoA carboxylase biotin carboxyl carrier protein [Anaerohalosphaera sp.]
MSDKKQTDIQKVKELIDLMIANDLVELEIVDGDNKVSLKRPQPSQQLVTHVPMAAPAAHAPAAAAVPAQAQDEGLIEIDSPMVGTFYASPSPDSDAFVKVGDRVEPNTVVCIVEAMKVLNEIKAEMSGTIEKVLCKAGQAVEYGQSLFKVKPD